MDLLVIRHAIAEEPDVFAASGRPDDERPLTTEGRRKMSQGAKGLLALVPEIGLLVTSPLVRAQQTAEIIARRYKIEVAARTDALRPGARPERFADWAGTTQLADVTAIVGHEPHLSTLVAWLAGVAHGPGVELKKGGACLLTFDSAPHRGEGLLRWLCTPAMLRRLGR
jgi:phosphohistidine phosphatase